MVSCLMCLEIIGVGIDSININSTQWQELDFTKKIEKHFWPLIKITAESVVCASCWKEVNNFHNFYMRIEETHLDVNKIKLEPGVVTVEDKNELLTHLPNECNKVQLDKKIWERYFLEPEILIEQLQTENLMDETAEHKFEIDQTLDDILLKQEGKHVQTLIDNNPLKKEENASEIKCFSKEKYGNQTESGVIDKSNATISTDISQLNNEEFDKLLGEHFIQMTCNICQMPLENFSATQKHFIASHQQKGYLICCNRKFYRRRELVEHIYCHLNPNIFKCTKCDKVLSNRVRLEKHVMVVHNGVQVKKHCCDTCGKSFLDIHRLNMHKATHLSVEKNFFCEECGKFYGSSNHLHRHIQNVHLKKLTQICYICGKSLCSSSELKFHLANHDGTVKPNCDICGVRLSSERALRRHKANQHPPDGKKDRHCPICQKALATPIALRKHVLAMHEKGCDHKCSICQKAFKRPSVLREHTASHMGTPLYTCPWCPKTFYSNSNMHSHRKKKHPKECQEAKLQKNSGNARLVELTT